MKKFFFTTLIVMLFSAQFVAQKTAFINEAKLLQNLPGYTNAKKETDEISKKFTAEIKEEREALYAKENQLLKSYNLNGQVSAEDLKNKLSEIDKKKYELLGEEAKLFEKKIQAKQDEYSQIYQQKVGSILNKATQEISSYCKKNKIDVLFKIDTMVSAVAYYDKEKDITDLIIGSMK
ncbi:OmpH family outer membrane protein [Chryseobacterium sp. Mn2064]|uniref:OmpH family outer membrane protein n=1 Tax=Chryseobacterium sp. Mn2064 TaxID=3395263 RepID=UPI003BC7AE6D